MMHALTGALVLVLLALASLPAPTTAGARTEQEATPEARFSCDGATTAEGTPAMEHGDMAGMDHGTPAAAVEFDQLYIDMMIPHHASIVAMAQAAEERLTDDRLRTIARRIVDTQSAEIEELQGYRQDFYGHAEPTPMDEQMMGMMTEMMPGMGDMAEMAHQMNPSAQVGEFCAAEDPDLAFIDLTIPHHEMAITASEAALDRAAQEEIRAFAERVIRDQQREIDELAAIRAELAGDATPTGSPTVVRSSLVPADPGGGRLPESS